MNRIYKLLICLLFLVLPLLFSQGAFEDYLKQQQQAQNQLEQRRDQIRPYR